MPIIVSSIGLMLMGVVDSFTVAKLGNNALAAQSLAVIINMTLFMGLAAFVFPVANLTQLDGNNQTRYLKSSLLILWIMAFGITIVNWIISPFIAQFLLPASQETFIDYFRYSSLRFLPGVTFFYLRMVLYTMEKPVQITRYVTGALILSIVGNALIYMISTDQNQAVRWIGAWGACLFLFLTWQISKNFPADKTLSVIWQASCTRQSIHAVLRVCFPAMLTSFLEYLFFCMVGIILLKNIPEQLSAYRIIMQFEELIILVFYSLSVVISVEFSKDFKQNRSPNLWQDSALYVTLALFVAILTFVTYPKLLLIFGITLLVEPYSVYIASSLLLVSECTMLLVLSYLRGMTENKLILLIMSFVNWGMMSPLLFYISANKLSAYLYLLIMNYLVITITSIFIFLVKFKYYSKRRITAMTWII